MTLSFPKDDNGPSQVRQNVGAISPTMRDMAWTHPVVFGIVLTVVWWAVLVGLAHAIPPLAPAWFPDLGPTLVNLGALAFLLVVVAVLGWWREAGLGPLSPTRGWVLLLPLLLQALSYAVSGLHGSAVQFASTGALFAVLGLNEELLSRGVTQHATRRLGPLRSVVWVAVLFGLTHMGNSLFFGRPVAVTGAQVASATAFGLAYATVRLRLGSIWPLAALHGLDDLCQTRSALAIPPWWHLGVALVNLAFAAWLLHHIRLTNARDGAVTTGDAEIARISNSCHEID